MKITRAFNLIIIFIIPFPLLFLSCASYQSVSFKSLPVEEDSLAIVGNLYKPEGNGPFPAVIVLHGCAGVDDHFRGWAKQLVEWGYIALIVDSFGPRGVDRVCGSPYRVSPIERALDSYGAAMYLKQLPYVDGENIGLMGFSHGGFTGMRAIQGNFLQAAKMETMPFKAAVMFYPWCDSVQDQVGIPTLILIGSNDDWTPADQCVELKKHLSNSDLVELIVFEGATHDFDRSNINMEYLGHRLLYDPDAAKLAKVKTKEFFDKYLLRK